jgi:hypothetical protein
MRLGDRYRHPHTAPRAYGPGVASMAGLGGRRGHGHVSQERHSPPRDRQQAQDDTALVRLAGQVQKIVRSAPTAADVVRRVNRLLAGRDVRVVEARFASRDLARRFEARYLARAEARRLTKAGRRLAGGDVEVPLRRHRRVLGSLVVAAGPATATRQAVIEAVAEGAAIAAHELLAASAHARAAAEQAHLDAQRRILLSARAHERQALQTIRAAARRVGRPATAGRRSPAEELVGAVDLLELQLEWAAVAADLVPFGRRTVQSSLRRLARWLAANSHLRVFVEVRGRPRPLDEDVARVLYEVANECLRVASGLRSCTRARVEVQFDDGVAIVVAADGLSPATADRLRATLGPLLPPAGSLHVQARRKGLVVRAAFPGRGRQA